MLLLLLRPHVCGMRRPNWWRTCHPSFLHCWSSSILSLCLRIIVDIGLRYTFWQLFVWWLSCVSELFLWVRVGGLDEWPCFDGYGFGRIVLGVGMVRQFRLVSWRLHRKLGWMGIRLLMTEGCTGKPITLLLVLWAIGCWHYLISCGVLLGSLCWPLLLVHLFVGALQNLWCVWCLDQCRTWLAPYL